MNLKLIDTTYKNTRLITEPCVLEIFSFVRFYLSVFRIILTVEDASECSCDIGNIVGFAGIYGIVFHTGRLTQYVGCIAEV